MYIVYKQNCEIRQEPRKALEALHIRWCSLTHVCILRDHLIQSLCCRLRSERRMRAERLHCRQRPVQWLSPAQPDLLSLGCALPSMYSYMWVGMCVYVHTQNDKYMHTHQTCCTCHTYICIICSQMHVSDPPRFSKRSLLAKVTNSTSRRQHTICPDFWHPQSHWMLFLSLYQWFPGWCELPRGTKPRYIWIDYGCSSTRVLLAAEF